MAARKKTSRKTTRRASSARKAPATRRKTTKKASPKRKTTTRKRATASRSAMQLEAAMQPKSSCSSGKGWFMWLLSEVSLYAFLYYGLYLLSVQANLWVASFLLLLLLNLAWWFCPSGSKCM